jgi:hypothetical protein
MKGIGWVTLLEACIGIGIGAAIALPLEFAVIAASGHPSSAGEMIARVCPPLGAPAGPGLDGDRVSLPEKGVLICDGISGNWETPETRATHLRERIVAMPWAIP